MKVTTKLKAGKLAGNENQTSVSGLAVKTTLRAGKIAGNENPTAVSGLGVKTNLKAGRLAGNDNSTAVRTILATRWSRLKGATAEQALRYRSSM